MRPELPNTNDDISLLYFTSGTTGEPKMVAHDFTYPLGHIITASYWHNLNEKSLHLTLADTGWGKAVWGKLYGQWIAGANVFVYDFEKFEPVDVLHMIHNYGITSFCAPPTVFRFLIREDLSKFDLSTLKYCTIAGEALNPKVYEEWLKLTGIKLMEGFGQTETTLTIATYPWLEPKPGSMGKKGPVYDIDLIAPDGRPVEDGEQGEIIVRTHGKKPLGLFKEYLHDPELTHAAYHDDIYHTGDVAWRDEDGYFWFVGRTDDVIKSSGYRIGPFEVESALMTHPAVVECAITGVPDEIRGQVVKATIVLAKEYIKRAEDAGEELIKDIQNHVKQVTAPYTTTKNDNICCVMYMGHSAYKLIAVKIGSNVLTRRDGTLDITRMSALVDQVAELHRRGTGVILVSSGAVASGRSELKLSQQLDTVSARQLYSAVGQAKLINRYYELFRDHGIACGQVLTTKENFSTRRHYLNQKHCMEVMLENGVIPVVNENDTVSLTELMFTDNDELSGLIASMMDVQALVILSNIDGVYDGDPSLPGSSLIADIRQVEDGGIGRHSRHYSQRQARQHTARPDGRGRAGAPHSVSPVTGERIGREEVDSP